nr:cysteine--tRNA ligase [Psychrobacter sp. I-STPA10]
MTAATQSLSTPLSLSQSQQIAPLFVYNSMNNQKQKFEPLQAGKVDMYVCGMTVYDYCHIGHARVMVAFDMIVRWFRQLGYEVTYVRNITDIDDKIIARAQQNNESIGALTQRFTKAMHEDAAALGCVSPDIEPRATAHIEEMQEMIAKLVSSNHAYAADNGDVYYAVDSFAEYGKLSGRQLDEMQAGSRVEVDTIKRNPFDFVLWKAAKPSEPHWASAWGDGRPGWHIECSAMSIKCLSNTFDIHGGGHDLQFPHHENEIAQSEATTGCTYANHWMHVGFINVDGEKMSKSLGNFFTIREVMQQYNPETIRFFILSSHYRSQVNFSDTALNDAHTGLTRLYQAIKNAEQLLADAKNDSHKADTDKANKTDVVYTSEVGREFVRVMNDDFNTAAAISVLFGLAKDINIAVKAEQVAEVATLLSQLKTLAASLNILQNSAQDFLQASTGLQTDNGLSTEQIEALIANRQAAKANKEFARADEIRELLKAQGVVLEDSRQGTTWRRES